MVTRRDWLKLGAAAAGAGAALSLDARLLRALQSGEMITRRIPSTGESLPVIGLGSSATFSQVARSEDVSGLREVLQELVDNGGKVFDTAPSYGASEEVAGSLTNELGIADRIFWATKVNVAGRSGGSADPAEARAQIERSFERFRVPVIDLIQVHDMADVPTHLGVLKEFKEEGRIRYIGATSTREYQYAELTATMRNEPLDFIGVDYAVDNRSAEEEILPLAQERGIGVLVYLPFGRARLFRRVGDRPLPDWAAGFDASTWAQFFIKFVVSHPAVTVVTPATSQARHMLDNLGGGRGRLPDEATRRRMAALVDALPSA